MPHGVVVVPEVSRVLCVGVAVGRGQLVYGLIFELVEGGRLVRRVLPVIKTVEIAFIVYRHPSDPGCAIVGDPGKGVSIEVGSHLQAMDVGH